MSEIDLLAQRDCDLERRREVAAAEDDQGRIAVVKVDQNGGKVKYASAHDLRRSFGERWATRVMPPVLQELMRHDSIQTTMRYYVGRNARNTASILWDVVKSQPAFSVGDTLGDTPDRSVGERSEMP